MIYHILPVSSEPRRVFLLDLSPDGFPLHARVEIRYLPAPDFWVLSIWDDAAGELLINQIPLKCSYGQINDLLAPFRYLRQGRGLGSLFVLKNTDAPDPPDPAENNMDQFIIAWGDTFDADQL